MGKSKPGLPGADSFIWIKHTLHDNEVFLQRTSVELHKTLYHPKTRMKNSDLNLSCTFRLFGIWIL